MIAKLVLFAFSSTFLLGPTPCCCARARAAKQPVGSEEPCGHCPKKPPSVPTLPHSKDCGCPHVSTDASADFAKISWVITGGPELEVEAGAVVPAADRDFKVAPFLDRGPPASRVNLPLYLLLRHLAI